MKRISCMFVVSLGLFAVTCSRQPTAPSAAGGEMELDPEAPDPPDVLEGDALDLTAIVTEHLALEIDPFPRKPDATFDYAPPPEDTSPFAVRKNLQKPKP